MGKYTPVYNVFYELGFNRFRSPVRFIYIFHLSTAILSGFGLNHLLSENESGTLVSKNSYKFQFRGSTSGAGLIIMLLIAVATVIYFLINYPLDRFQEMSLSITDYKILWYRDAIITLDRKSVV